MNKKLNQRTQLTQGHQNNKERKKKKKTTKGVYVRVYDLFLFEARFGDGGGGGPSSSSSSPGYTYFITVIVSLLGISWSRGIAIDSGMLPRESSCKVCHSCNLVMNTTCHSKNSLPNHPWINNFSLCRKVAPHSRHVQSQTQVSYPI
jgi:hypothetical protein